MKPIKNKGPRRPWTVEEINTALDIYEIMLRNQAAGTKYVKAPMIRALAEVLGRTKGSCEAKFMNISAVRAELGLVYVTGYKPLSNVQKLLRDTVTEHINNQAWQGARAAFGG